MRGTRFRRLTEQPPVQACDVELERHGTPEKCDQRAFEVVQSELRHMLGVERQSAVSRRQHVDEVAEACDAFANLPIDNTDGRSEWVVGEWHGDHGAGTNALGREDVRPPDRVARLHELRLAAPGSAVGSTPRPPANPSRAAADPRRLPGRRRRARSARPGAPGASPAPGARGSPGIPGPSRHG